MYTQSFRGFFLPRLERGCGGIDRVLLGYMWCLQRWQSDRTIAVCSRVSSPTYDMEGEILKLCTVIVACWDHSMKAMHPFKIFFVSHLELNDIWSHSYFNAASGPHDTCNSICRALHSNRGWAHTSGGRVFLPHVCWLESTGCILVISSDTLVPPPFNSSDSSLTWLQMLTWAGTLSLTNCAVSDLTRTFLKYLLY